MVSPPAILRLAYPGVIWNLPREEKVLYLTFDDGPVPGVTDAVLDLLKGYQAHATFFCIGANVEKHPGLFNRIQSEGHSIGNHTYTHPNSWKVSKKKFLEDVETASALIPSSLFRPPYGKLTPGVLFSLRKKYKIIMWDVISCDFDEKVPVKQVYLNVTENTRPGSVIVFHDSLKAAPRMLEVLPDVLEYYAMQGYRFDMLKGVLTAPC